MAAVLAVAGLAAVAPASVADTGDVGFEDGAYNGASNPPTSDKPQSKLWYNDGSWWAVMYVPASADWRIFRLDRSAETWVNTGVPVDSRKQTLSDVLWDGKKLYVASNWVTESTLENPKASLSGKPARLYRYTYSGGTYTLDSGFPTAINDNSSESLTIDEDTTGRVWATWTQVTATTDQKKHTTKYSAKVYVNSAVGGASWGKPTVLPTPGSTVTPDDISSVVAFGRSSIGVIYGNQNDGTVYWAVHRDGSDLNKWQGGQALRGTGYADDHLNVRTIQTDTQGRVYAVAKTSLDESGSSKSDPQINLLVYKPGTGTWTVSKVGTVSDCHTRPILVLDQQNSQVRVFATAPSGSGCSFSGQPGTIYEKSASMSDLVFPAGRGTPVIRDADAPGMNNVTSTKQPVTNATGLVLLAGNNSTKRYWHADLPVGSPGMTGGKVARAAVSSRVVATATNGIDVPRPGGTSSGDVLVACLTTNGAKPTASGVPAGWTRFAAVTGVPNPHVWGYYKVASGSEPSSYHWTFNAAIVSSGGIARYTGASGITGTASTASGAAAKSATVPGVTASARSVLVGCMGANSGSASFGIIKPASMTTAWDLLGKRQQADDELVAAAGSTGSRTWTFSASRAWAGWLVALKPAS